MKTLTSRFLAISLICFSISEASARPALESDGPFIQLASALVSSRYVAKPELRLIEIEEKRDRALAVFDFKLEYLEDTADDERATEPHWTKRSCSGVVKVDSLTGRIDQSGVVCTR